MSSSSRITLPVIRRCLSLLFCAVSAVASAQSLVVAPIRSIDPADTIYSDLSSLRTAIGNARIVLLGEQTHGEGSTFLAKSRLVRFLHEEMGFEVLAFESGFYDCARIWENTKQGSSFINEIPGSLFYMYATSKQMHPLFAYIQSQVKSARPLEITGFESQHSGKKAKEELFPDFERFLQQRYPMLLQDSSWSVFRRVSLATFNARAYRPTAAEKAAFFRQLDQLKRTLRAYHGADNGHFASSPGFWYQVTCSIESQATRYWEMVKGNEVSVRDRQMAENLIWLSQKAFPGKKIIVWAHNVHIAKNTSTLQTTDGSPLFFFNTFVPMGATISEHFGKKAYSIGFAGTAGRYMDYTNDQITPVPAPMAGSIEAQIAAAGHPYGFTDYRKFKNKGIQPGVLADYAPLKASWPNIFDGLFFIATAVPVDRP